jgi:hypothetical protein
MLRKGVIKDKMNKAEYLVTDIFDKKIFTVRISGKQRLNHKGFKIGEEIYFVCSPYEPNRCRLINSTDYKMDDNNTIYAEKIKLDKKQIERN